VSDELVTQTIDLPGGALRVLQPAEAAELPDDHEVEWAPLAPYWAVLWRSGVALAAELAEANVRGKRIVELGCGLAVPSIAAARGGAGALATDADPDPFPLVRRNAEANGVAVETLRVEWAEPDALLELAPFDLAVAADVLYEREAAALLLGLLPRLAPTALVADPGRPAADAFLERARERWSVTTTRRGIVSIHRLEFR